MNNTVIVAATPNLQHSLDFYEKLNFTFFENHGKHYVVDGTIIMEVTDEKYIRSGVKLFKESWIKEVELLKEILPVSKVEGGYVLMDFTGIWIQLDENEGFEPEIEFAPESLLGNAAGLSLEGVSIPQMNKIWKILGFQKTMGDENSGWMTVKNDDGLTISLMQLNACPHSFYNPSLTYFNGDKNLEIISKIRAAGIPITEEITFFNKEGIVDNIIIRDPGGLGFFIFSD